MTINVASISVIDLVLNSFDVWSKDRKREAINCFQTESKAQDKELKQFE